MSAVQRLHNGNKIDKFALTKNIMNVPNGNCDLEGGDPIEHCLGGHI